MRLLLDSHVLVWLVEAPERLGPASRAMLEDLDNQLFASVASLWELAIKSALGRVRLAAPLSDIVAQLPVRSAVTIIAIEAGHALAVMDLPSHHGDPFDRLLLAQAKVEDMTLITADRTLLGRYAVPVLDARH